MWMVWDVSIHGSTAGTRMDTSALLLQGSGASSPRPSPSAHSDFSLISPPQRDPSSPTKSHRPFTLLYFLPECSLLSEMLPFTSRSFLLERKSQALMDRFFVHLLFPALGMESGTK